MKATKHLADVLFFSSLNPLPSPTRIKITDITHSDQNSISVKKKMQSKDQKEKNTNFGNFFYGNFRVNDKTNWPGEMNKLF